MSSTELFVQSHMGMKLGLEASVVSSRFILLTRSCSYLHVLAPGPRKDAYISVQSSYESSEVGITKISFSGEETTAQSS